MFPLDNFEVFPVLLLSFQHVCSGGRVCPATPAQAARPGLEAQFPWAPEGPSDQLVSAAARALRLLSLECLTFSSSSHIDSALLCFPSRLSVPHLGRCFISLFQFADSSVD